MKSTHLQKMVTHIGFIFALTILGVCTSGTSTVAAPDDANTAQSSAVRDGAHDFDFIYGKWRMPNHRLKKRLVDSHEMLITGRPATGKISLE